MFETFTRWTYRSHFHLRSQKMGPHTTRFLNKRALGNLNNAFFMPSPGVLEESHKEPLWNPMAKSRPLYFIALERRWEE